MNIDSTNYTDGNRAVASALLLYYYLASEGRFVGDETVFIDPDLFEGFRYLDVNVVDGYENDINEKLLREAAVIYLLCDLNDMISEHEDSFRSTVITQKIVSAFEDGKLNAVPETSEIFGLLEHGERDFDYRRYHEVLEGIYNKYILGTFARLSRSETP